MGGACVNNPQNSANQRVRTRSFRTNRTFKGLAPRVATKPAATSKLVGSVVDYGNQVPVVNVVPPVMEVSQNIIQTTQPVVQVSSLTPVEMVQPVVQQVAQPVSFVQQGFQVQPVNVAMVETVQQQPQSQMYGGSSRIVIRPTTSLSMASPKGLVSSGTTAFGNSITPQNMSVISPMMPQSPMSMTRQQIPASMANTQTNSAIPTLSMAPSIAQPLPALSRNSVHTSISPSVSPKMVTSITSNNYPTMITPSSLMGTSQRNMDGPIPPLPPLSPRNDISFKMTNNGPVTTLHSNPPMLEDPIRQSVSPSLIPSTIPLPINSNTKSMTAGHGILINDFVNNENFNPTLYRPLSMSGTRLQLL